MSESSILKENQSMEDSPPEAAALEPGAQAPEQERLPSLSEFETLETAGADLQPELSPCAEAAPQAELSRNKPGCRSKKKKPPRWLAAVCVGLAVIALMALVFALSAASGQESAPVFDLYTYDSQGRVVSHTKRRSDGTVSFRRECSYDESGNRSSLRIYDGSGKLSYGEECSYQDGMPLERTLLSPEGSLIQRKVYEYENGALLGKSSYDAYGNLLQYIRYTANGKALYWEIYEYNNQRQATAFYRYNADRSIDYRWEYVYDENGLEISRSRYNSKGDKTAWSEYEYDQQGRILLQKQYDSSGELNTQTEFSYNEDGSFSVWTYFYDYDGTMSRELSIYDKNGNRTHYAAYPSGGYLSHGSDSRYDENGNIIEHSEFGLYGVTYIWYTYEYDDQGRELRRYTHGLYERPSSYENVYDQEGNCIERIYYDETGNETKRVEDPAPEVSFRMSYRPDW